MTAGNVAEWLSRSIGDNHAMSITHIRTQIGHKWILSTTVGGRVVRGEGPTAQDAVTQFEHEFKNLRE